jgi:hypothetical protein
VSSGWYCCLLQNQNQKTKNLMLEQCLFVVAANGNNLNI